MMWPLFDCGETGVSQGHPSVSPEVFDSGSVHGVSHSMQMARGLCLPNVLRSVGHPLHHTAVVCVSSMSAPNLSHIWHNHAPLPSPSPRVVRGSLSGGDTHTRNPRRPTPAATGHWQ